MSIFREPLNFTQLCLKLKWPVLPFHRPRVYPNKVLIMCKSFVTLLSFPKVNQQAGLWLPQANTINLAGIQRRTAFWHWGGPILVRHMAKTLSPVLRCSYVLTYVVSSKSFSLFNIKGLRVLKVDEANVNTSSHLESSSWWIRALEAWVG